MARLVITATANPQDYYEGAEPRDLRIRRVLLPDQMAEAVKFAETCCREGYAVIITLYRGEEDG